MKDLKNTYENKNHLIKEYRPLLSNKEKKSEGTNNKMIIINGGEEEELKKLIETLPREKGVMGTWDLCQYKGFWHIQEFLPTLISLQQNFKAQPTDIVLCSFPKTGTTWLKALTFAITTRNQYAGTGTGLHDHPLLTRMPHDCVPFMEMDLVVVREEGGDHDNGKGYKRDPKIPLLATHLPYTSLPKSIVESSSGCKIVYIWRDPKDTFVSLWHFLKKGIGISNGETNKKFNFEAEFDRFCQGKSIYGPFWDHVLEFWNASLEYPEKVLFLKYENMKKDTLLYIRMLAEFMNQPFSEDEEKEGVPKKIMELCSFQNLSSLEVNKKGQHQTGTGFEIDNNLYFRKGEAGGWKTHLTMEMAERMDAITIQKFDGPGLLS